MFSCFARIHKRDRKIGLRYRPLCIALRGKNWIDSISEREWSGGRRSQSAQRALSCRRPKPTVAYDTFFLSYAQTLTVTGRRTGQKLKEIMKTHCRKPISLSLTKSFDSENNRFNRKINDSALSTWHVYRSSEGCHYFHIFAVTSYQQRTTKTRQPGDDLSWPPSRRSTPAPRCLQVPWRHVWRRRRRRFGQQLTSRRQSGLCPIAVGPVVFLRSGRAVI